MDSTLYLWLGCTLVMLAGGDGLWIVPESKLDFAPSKAETESSEKDVSKESSPGIEATLEVKVAAGVMSDSDQVKGVICIKRKGGRCTPVSSGSRTKAKSGDKASLEGEEEKLGPIMVSDFDDPVKEDEDSGEGGGDSTMDTRPRKPKDNIEPEVPVFVGTKGATPEPEQEPPRTPSFVPSYRPGSHSGVPSNGRRPGVSLDRRDPHYDVPDYTAHRHPAVTGFYGGQRPTYHGYPKSPPIFSKPAMPSYAMYPTGLCPSENWPRPGSHGRSGARNPSWQPAPLWERNTDIDGRSSFRAIAERRTTTEMTVNAKLGGVLEGVTAVRKS